MFFLFPCYSPFTESIAAFFQNGRREKLPLTYLAPPKLYEDHWICEYWDSKENKWKRADPQIDLFQHKMIREWTEHYDDLQYKRKIFKFDNLNIKTYDFYSAGNIWNKVRDNKTNAKKYGLYSEPKSFGQNFIKANLLRDFACLNKEEPRVNFIKNTEFWEKWELSNKPVEELTSDEFVLLDTIADYSEQDEIDVDLINAFYKDNKKIQIPEQSE